MITSRYHTHIGVLVLEAKDILVIMAKNRNIKVTLHDNEYDFLKWLAKRDGVTVSEEMKMLFNLQLSEEMDLYFEEMQQERGKQ